MEPLASIPLHTEPTWCYVRRLEYEARQACHWQQRFLDLEASHNELKAQFTSAVSREQELRAKCEELESHHMGKMALLEHLGSSRNLLSEKDRQLHLAQNELVSKAQALEEGAAYQNRLVGKLSELQERLENALKAAHAKDLELEKWRAERPRREEEFERLRCLVACHFEAFHAVSGICGSHETGGTRQMRHRALN